MSHRIAILDGYRTPFVKAAGPLKGLGADDLGAVVVRELLARTGIGPAEVDEVIFGNVAQPIHAPNIARVIALKAGIPQTTIAHTVHRNCASGMQSITTAALEILSGRADIVVAGGTESMSQVPLMVGAKMTEILVRLMRARTLGQRMKAIASIRPAYLRPVIALELALTDPIVGLNMGQTAEVLAREFAVSRREQDELAQRSHRLAAAAMEAGRLDEEIIPITVAPSYRTIVTHDIGPDGDISLEALGRRRPYFDRQAGTVTVGNSCPITDGAAAVVLCSEQKAKQLGVTPLGYLDRWAYAAAGSAPRAA
jgi:acetyl-CoA C-acetyltransferase/acetyl-CoA acyltransferase